MELASCLGDGKKSRNIDARISSGYVPTMRRALLALAFALLLGGMQACASTGKGAVSHVKDYAAHVAQCVGKKIAECAAPPVKMWCPECARHLQLEKD